MFNLKVRHLLFVFVISAGLISCKDSSSTETPDIDPPTLPHLQQFQPDFSYFGVQSKSNSVQAGEGYTLAAQLVQTSVVPLFSLADIYFPFLLAAEQAEADFANGVWEWSYNYSGFGETAGMRLTAEESGQNMDWALFVSVNSNDVNFDNYLFMDGQTANDGSQGTWSIYGLEEEGTTPVFTFDWMQEDENNQSATYEIITPDTEESVIMNYSREDIEHLLDFNSNNGEEQVTVYWNTGTGVGYLQGLEAGQLCWDQDHEDVECE